MRTLATLSALALFGLAQPAAAMCGSGQQASTSTSSSAMMCGAMPATATDAAADKPAQPQQSGGMCACCRNMAMRGGQGGGTMNMPDQPKQQ